MLHAENASIFLLLPEVATGLLTQVSLVDEILKFIREQVTRSAQNQQKIERLLLVKDSLQKSDIPRHVFSLNVDEQKSLLLAHAFGEIYTPALALFTGKHICIQYFADTAPPSSEAIKHGILCSSGNDSVFMKVSSEPCIQNKEEAPDVNPFLQMRAMVAKLGLILNLTTFEVEKLDSVEGSTSILNKSDHDGSDMSSNVQSTGLYPLSSQGESSANNVAVANTPEENIGRLADHTTIPIFEDPSKVLIDPYNWFCSCCEFTNNSLLPHSRSGQQITADSQSSLTTHLFRHAICNYQKNVPVCKHILAVLLMLLNWSAAVQAGLIRIYWVKSEFIQTEIPL